MKLSSLYFELPEKLIAKYPKPNREDARLMVVDRDTEIIEHYSFKDLPKFFKKEDVLVLNDARVIAGQLDGYKEKTNSKVNVLLLRELHTEHHLWDAWIDPARKIRVGNKLCFGNELIAQVIDNTTSRERTLKFVFDGNNEMLQDLFDILGQAPIPATLGRKPEEIDRERYQTVYASETGGVAAPSAGFNLSRRLLKYLQAKGILLPSITMHLGLSTFKQLDVEDLGKYKMHTEYYNIPKEAASTVNRALKNNKKVCVVGTSTLKTVESSISYERDLKAGDGWTSKFVHPPYQPIIANALLTNFHLPRSTDFVSTLGFTGADLGMEIYESAIEEEYNFFCYGDSLLVI